MTTATHARPKAATKPAAKEKSNGRARPTAKPAARRKRARAKATPTRPAKAGVAIRFIPIDQLHVSALNMRANDAEPDIGDLYPSVLKRGVQQSLLVRPESKEGSSTPDPDAATYGVVAGRRRLAALRRKQQETGEPQSAPCLVMDTADELAAREASLAENLARLPATELEQFAAFKALADTGEDAEAIAQTFGITTLRVRRILALANLHPDVLALFESESLDWRTLQALTLATPEQQAAWMKMLKDPEQHAPRGSDLKDWLTGGVSIATSAALFDMDAYAGAIVSDLFGRDGENAYFSDPDVFWEHQNTAIAARVEALEAEGWADVVLLPRGERFQSWNFGKRDRDAGGKVFVEVGYDGTVREHEGYLSHADIKRIDAILKGGSDTAADSKPAKPEMSGPLAEYVALHRLSAARATLLGHPGVALRLAVAHMVCGSELWTVERQKMQSRNAKIAESVEACEGERLFARARGEALETLRVIQQDAAYGGARRVAAGDVADVFARLLPLSDARVMELLAWAVGETLKAGTVVAEAALLATDTDVDGMWSPDDAFFALLRDKSAINAMVKDIAGKACADSVVTDTGKTQKQVIRNRMSGTGVGKDEAKPEWRPRWMRREAAHYLAKSGCPVAQSNARARKLLDANAAKGDTA